MLWTAPGVKLPSYRKNGFKASWWRCAGELPWEGTSWFPSQLSKYIPSNWFQWWLSGDGATRLLCNFTRLVPIQVSLLCDFSSFFFIIATPEGGAWGVRTERAEPKAAPKSEDTKMEALVAFKGKEELCNKCEWGPPRTCKIIFMLLFCGRILKATDDTLRKTFSPEELGLFLQKLRPKMLQERSSSTTFLLGWLSRSWRDIREWSGILEWMLSLGVSLFHSTNNLIKEVFWHPYRQ